MLGVRGWDPVPLGLYQPSNLRIAAVIRPEIVPARMSLAKVFIQSGCVAGFRLRRFLFAIASAYDRINLTVPKGKKDIIQAHAEAMGMSVNGFLNRVAEGETMDRDKRAQEGPGGPLEGKKEE